MASTTQIAAPRRRFGRMVGGAFILLGCLVIPWLVPWSGSADRAGQPSSSETAERVPGGSSADPTSGTPDAGAVRRLREATRNQARGDDLPVSAKDLSTVPTRPGPYRKLGRLEIPSLSLSVSYGGGVFAETLDKGPGHWPGTPAPGSPGNAVISGHRNTHTRPFKELDELDPGDKIITSYEDRDPVTFEVVKTTIVPESEYRDFVLRQPTDATARELTLFACHPEGNPVFRIVVEARAQR